MRDYDETDDLLSNSFERDESGQLFYAPASARQKIAIDESEYEEACRRLKSRTAISKIILFVAFAISLLLIVVLSIKRNFQISYLLLLVAPIGVYYVAVAWAAYSSVAPLAQKSFQATGGLKPRTKLVARTGWAIVVAIAAYFIVRANM